MSLLQFLSTLFNCKTILWIIIGLIRVFHLYSSLSLSYPKSYSLSTLNQHVFCTTSINYFYEQNYWVNYGFSNRLIRLFHLYSSPSLHPTQNHTPKPKKNVFFTTSVNPFVLQKLLDQLWIFNKLIRVIHTYHLFFYIIQSSKTILSIYSLIKYTRNPTSHNKTENGSVAPPWPPLQQPNVAQKKHPKKE